MPLRTLRFKIRQDGLVEESVEGVLGNSCNELTERLEEALGVVENKEPTGEAYIQPSVGLQSLPAELH